ncbi:MAG: type III pantothenate kinase [Planctomycetota bacterium]
MPRLDASVMGGTDAGAVGFVALAVGNSRARLGRFDGRELADPRSMSIGHSKDDAKAVADAVRSAMGDQRLAVVMSSVHAEASDRIAEALTGIDVHRVGRDVPVPIDMAVDDVGTVGQDRLLCALAAWTRSKTACVVVDAGTALTVDFVDGEGVFQGGAIVPGVRMMLAAMASGTAALPEVDFDPAEEPGPFGKDTRRAMALGARSALRGAVRELVDSYAIAYEAYPPVVATGGDAELLMHEGGLVEYVVPDLQLMGIQASVEAAVESAIDDGDAG